MDGIDKGLTPPTVISPIFLFDHAGNEPSIGPTISLDSPSCSKGDPFFWVKLLRENLSDVLNYPR